MNDTMIHLTPAEIQSGQNRIDMAENLILQLPDNHEGRNSWLLNFGRKIEARVLRSQRGLKRNPAYGAIYNGKPTGVEVRNKYKIHALTTASGTSRGANNNKFYETYEDALERAEQCVNRDGNSIVIYKAIQVVEVEHTPIKVRNVL